MPLGIGSAKGRGQRRRMRQGRRGRSLTGPAGIATATVNVEKCVGCGKCAEVCPVAAISIVDGKAVVDGSRCHGCRACASVCPTGAIT